MLGAKQAAQTRAVHGKHITELDKMIPFVLSKTGHHPLDRYLSNYVAALW